MQTSEVGSLIPARQIGELLGPQLAVFVSGTLAEDDTAVRAAFPRCHHSTGHQAHS